MNWTASYRQIATEAALRRGLTYEQFHQDVPVRHLLLIDPALVWRRIVLGGWGR